MTISEEPLIHESFNILESKTGLVKCNACLGLLKNNNLKRIQKILDVKLEIMDETSNYSNEIILEHQKEETIILSDAIKITNEPYDIKTFTDHVKYCNNHNFSYGYPAGCIINKEHLLNGFADIHSNFIKYDYYYTKVPNLKSFRKYPNKKEGIYAVIYHNGYYDTMFESYIKLFNFIKENNLQIDSCSYEDVLIDEVATNNNDDYVLKISIKVTENNISKEI